MRLLLTVGLAIGFVIGPSRLHAGETGSEFFERRIRPVLVEHCYACHSVEAESRKKLRGGLRVDTLSGLLEGGDSGPAVVPGNTEESLLLEALRYDGSIQMPPKGKLPDPVLADVRRWIEMGAPHPRDDAQADALNRKAKTGASSATARSEHWAYQPLKAGTAPAVSDRSWPSNDIDQFVLAALEARGLRPVGQADRATLARRISFDLTGLPPTLEAVDAFVADESPIAYETFVDRLLASPQFGERWGRHWLDVVRFAESLTLRGFILTGTWRYRDYVIEAFNRDLPYDRFIQEQIAGDLLPASSLDDQRRQWTAASFLVLGNTNLEEQDKEQLRMDVVDEQIDTIGKVFLAQTVGCARCHDHKFDPIPTRDYYAMAGIFRNVKALEHANVSKWMERPLPVEPEQEAKIERFERALADLEARIKAERARLTAAGKPAEGILAVKDIPGVVVDDTQATRVGQWKSSQFSRSYIGEGYLHDENAEKGRKSLTFQPELPRAGTYEICLAYSAGKGRAAAVPVTILSADGETVVSVDMTRPPSIEGRYISLGVFRFETKNQGYVLISNEGTTGHVVADAVVFLPRDENREARSAGRTSQDGEDPESRLHALEAELKTLRGQAPPRDMIVTVFEEKEIGDTRIHVRGSVHNLGETVPRGFLSVLAPPEPTPLPSSESGRRELAAWIASPANPLTARVMVNRVWHWLFGEGLVRTTDNFGTTGELPSHPELLDHLALEFIADGWSIKRLVRRIVLSRTYQLAALDDPRARAADPENRLCWKHDRRRLDAECLRDTILVVSGQLDRRMGGPGYPPNLTADYGFHEGEPRRSVYLPVFRNALPEFLEVFDFADPSMVTGRRNRSTIAPQALFLLNHPFVRDQADAAARRLLAAPEKEEAGRLTLAYRWTLGRPPTDREREITRRFLGESADRDEAEAWSSIFRALFASIEFRYIN